MLEREKVTYLREKQRLIGAGKSGRWALIHGEKVVSDWPSFADAVASGYSKIWPGLFMVRQICEQEPVIHLPAALWERQASIMEDNKHETVG